MRKLLVLCALIAGLVGIQAAPASGAYDCLIHQNASVSYYWEGQLKYATLRPHFENICTTNKSRMYINGTLRQLKFSTWNTLNAATNSLNSTRYVDVWVPAAGKKLYCGSSATPVPSTSYRLVGFGSYTKSNGTVVSSGNVVSNFALNCVPA